jgi:hypothetical protein
VGFSGGLVALNDRIKLRPLVAARQGSILMVASEESALREVLSAPDGVWAPKAGEPVVARIPSMPWPIPGDGHVTVAEPAPPAEAPAAEAALPAADFCVAAL